MSPAVPVAPPITRTGSKTRFLKNGSKSWMRNNSAKVPYVAVHLVGEVDAEGKVLVKDEAGTKTRAQSEGLYPTNLDQQPDCSLLFHLSEAALLANLLTRDALTLPYTTTGNVLTSINPCKPVPELYSVDTMKQYVDRRPAACPPHLYAVAEQSYRNLCRTAASQAIVVSGVSGAGKTEANKHIMQYLCWRAGQRPESKTPTRRVSAELLDVQLSEVSRCVLQSSVVFEASTAHEHAHVHVLYVAVVTTTTTSTTTTTTTRPSVTRAPPTTTTRPASASLCGCSSNRTGRSPALLSTPTCLRSRASSRSVTASVPSTAFGGVWECGIGVGAGLAGRVGGEGQPRPARTSEHPSHAFYQLHTSRTTPHTSLQASAPSTSSTSFFLTTSCAPSSLHPFIMLLHLL